VTAKSDGADQPKKSDGIEGSDQNQTQNMARAPAEIAIVQPEARPTPASSHANELVRASGSPEASRGVTPDAMLTDGRKADGRSEFEQIPDVAKAEPTLEQDDAR